MNNILTLRGKPFTQKSRAGGIVVPTMPTNSKVTLQELKKLFSDLEKIQKFWISKKLFDGLLISIYYKRIVPKSNRIQGMLKKDSRTSTNESIVGAKFNSDKNKHIITHFISLDTLFQTMSTLKNVINLFEASFASGVITDAVFADSSQMDRLDYTKYNSNKSTFKAFIRDACFVEKFDIEIAERETKESSIISFFDVHTDLVKVLAKIGINIEKSSLLNEYTALLDEKNIELLYSKAPYLVSMAVKDITQLSPSEFRPFEGEMANIPVPHNEPIVGVIDTLFDNSVYFSEWVEYYDMINPDITNKKEPQDYQHGTGVSSLIVDCAALNPNLDDGCGRFRVRHFGLSLDSGFSSFIIIKQIKEIVSQNSDIKVWNLSLGSNDEVRDNFISAEAATLDEIQCKQDVLFVIAGTNLPINENQRKKIGAPADSLNSVVVNSVDFHDNPANYSRTGIVLSFFMKPDVSYYGGNKDSGDFINVCEPLGLQRVTGTSYAAPLVARKLAYLIGVMGLNREEAKALLIDSAIGWNRRFTFEELTLMGNGVVPIRIEDILSTPNDEIKFLVSGISEKYDSFNYDFPVPISKEKYPYVAKATMCYFPSCSRNQGVDYTNTELQLSFGRLKLVQKKSGIEEGIDSINKDKQNLDFEENHYLYEKDARMLFRKWDNVKHIGESFSSGKRSKPILNANNPQWGISVKTIERLKKRDGLGVRFGIVVTLKELDGINRIEDFIQRAGLRGWIVNQLNMENEVKVYNQLTQEIEFE